MKKRNLLTILSTIIIMSAVAYYTFPAIRDARASWVYTDYLYRAPITFTHNADISSTRRVSIIINTSTLISAGKMQSDCDDSRFTNEAQKKLRYQLISGCNTTTTSYDVEVLSAVNGTNTLYLYYGNNSATSESTDISSVTSLSPSGGAPASGSEETAVTPTLMYSLDEGYGTTAQDTTQQNRDGTISGALWRTEDLCVSGKCLYFDGTDDVVTTTGTTSNVLTVSFWVRPMTTTEQLVDLNGSAYIQTSSGTISATGFTSPTIYVNGKATSSLEANRWQHVVVTTGTGISASALKLGQISTNYGQLFMDEFQLYTTQLTANQVQSLYNARGGNLTAVQQGAYDQKALSDGLVGYWKMDESSGNATDSSGNDTTLTNNSTTPYTGAKFGNSAELDGTTDYFEAADNATLSLTGSITLSAWINNDDTTGSQNILGKWDGTNNSYLLTLEGDELRMYIDSTSNYQTTTATNLGSNTFTHVAGVYDSTNQTVKLYVNGSEQTSTITGTIPSSIGDDAGEIVVGADDSPSNYFDGHIDDARIYNRTLTPAEIQQLYNWAPGPVGYWKMDEGSGTSAIYDYSGNNLTTTLTNMLTTNWVSGRYGKSLNFNGSTQYASVTHNSLLNITSDFSTFAWVYLSSETANDKQIIAKGSADFSQAIDMGLNGSENLVCGWSGQSYSTTFITVPLNQWMYLGCVFRDDLNTMYYYQDGILKEELGSAYYTGNPSTNTEPMIFGARQPDGYKYFFPGKLDDIKIYNYARTSSQIIQDMNAGHPLVGTPVAGPVAHWSFDEGYGTTANDQTPNNNDLTLNTASWTNNGKFGKAWTGTGSTKLTRADDADFDFAASDDFSISIWARSTSATNPSTDPQMLVDKGDNSAAYSVYFDTSGRINFGIDDDTTFFPEDDRVGSSTDLYDGNWHHYVAVKQGTTAIRIYVDGKLIEQDTTIAATGTLANSDFLVVGSENNVDSYGAFNGQLDEVKIYRAALSATDILQEYNQGKSLVLGSLSTESNGTTPSNASSREFCVPGDTSTCNAPVADWSFDERSGTTANDTSGNGNSGTLSNGPTWTTGKIGQSILFDGTDDTIDAGSATVVDNLPATGMSISTWIYPTSMGENSAGFILAKNSGTTANSGWILHLSGTNALTFTVDGSTDLVRTTSSNAITLNTWNHIALSWDGNITTASSVRIQINGNEASYATTTNGASRVSDATSNVYIGNDSTGARTFAGRIDNTKLYNYSRSVAQMNWDYNKGKPIAHWQFDETSGTIAYDASNNANNATLTVPPTQTSDGKFNNALDFSNDVVRVVENNTTDLGSTSSSYSISAWVKTANASSRRGIVAKANVSFQSGASPFVLSINFFGQTYFELCSGLFACGTVTSTQRVDTNTWQHIVGIRDVISDQLRLFINGNLVASSTDPTGGSVSNNADISIGNFGTSYTEYPITGQIDDVRIYNYPLTSEQVKLIMNDNAAIKW